MVNSLFNNRLDDIIIKNSKQLVFMLFSTRRIFRVLQITVTVPVIGFAIITDFFVLVDLILCKMIFELCHIWGQTKGRSGLCYINKTHKKYSCVIKR